MVLYYLKRILIVFIITFSSVVARGQQSHFVYLQTENGNPFYVRLNNKIISSSPAGYVILPSLDDGDYQIMIGFPKNEFPEEGFKITIDKKNEGFLLKNFGEKGWGLFNLQSLALLPGTSSNVAAIAPTTTTTPAQVPKKNQDDAFSTMLADVVKDSSILTNNNLVVTPKDSGAAKETAVAVEDTPVQKKEDTAESQAIKTPEAPARTETTPSITKLMGVKSDDGLQMVYLDKSDNDTVRVFIPAEKTKGETSQKVENKDKVKDSVTETDINSLNLTITPTVVKPEDTDTVTLINDTIKVYKEQAQKNVNAEPTNDSVVKKENPSPTIAATLPDRDNKSSEKKNENTVILLPKVVTSSSVNSDCKAFATSQDFLKLRKKMAAESTNDDMVQAAKKVFRTKCFSTEQIKNLSYLFLSDGGKYMFFDAAYPFTSDSDQYQILESQLSDEYYINRFKAMIHK